MSTIKLLVISAITFLLCLFLQNILETPTNVTPFFTSKEFANKDQAFQFDVPTNGQMMRFEIVGSVPMNTWKSIDIDVYDQAGNYLFTYQDELWSESGRDSDGKWTEYRKKAKYEQRFPKKGRYEAYVSDNSGPNNYAKSSQYRMRVIPIRGNGTLLTPILWISGAIALFCFIILANRAEQEKSVKYRPIQPLGNKTTPRKGKSVLIVVTLFIAPTLGLTVLAFQNNDDDIDWLHYSYRHKQLSVDRDLRQQSLSGAEFRTGGSRGGK